MRSNWYAPTGLDLFGRVADQRWVDGSTGDGSDVDRLKYGHDRNSNPLYKQNLLASGHSEVFTYDGLDRMQTFKRGSIALTDSLAEVATPTRNQRAEQGTKLITLSRSSCGPRSSRFIKTD
jgi:hypothetical protein